MRESAPLPMSDRLVSAHIAPWAEWPPEGIALCPAIGLGTMAFVAAATSVTTGHLLARCHVHPLVIIGRGRGRGAAQAALIVHRLQDRPADTPVGGIEPVVRVEQAL